MLAYYLINFAKYMHHVITTEVKVEHISIILESSVMPHSIQTLPIPRQPIILFLSL